MGDVIREAVRLFNINKDFMRFRYVMSQSIVYTFAPASASKTSPPRLTKISGNVNDRQIAYVSFFSEEGKAQKNLEYLFEAISGNAGRKVQIVQVNGYALFSYALKNQLAVYFNPNIPSTVRKLFSKTEVHKFFENDPNKPSKPIKPIPSPVQRQWEPLDSLDFKNPRTAEELADIFGAVPEAIKNIIKLLAENKMMPVSLATPGVKRKYNPLLAFYIAHHLNTERTREFRAWHDKLLEIHYFKGSEKQAENKDFVTEITNLRNELVELSKEKSRFKREWVELTNEFKAKTATDRRTIECLEMKLRETSGEVEAKNYFEALSKLNERITELQNDLLAAEEWQYPTSLSEVWTSAAKLYGSRLVFDEDRIEKGLSDFTGQKNPKVVAEFVKMVKSLALSLHPMKFKSNNFSEERFKDETGFELSMTESRATKRDKAMDEPRICHYKGKEILCYPHLKSAVGGLQLRLHFQFLDDEEKIIIGHLGGHLPNAMTKHLK